MHSFHVVRFWPVLGFLDAPWSLLCFCWRWLLLTCWRVTSFIGFTFVFCVRIPLVQGGVSLEQHGAVCLWIWPFLLISVVHKHKCVCDWMFFIRRLTYNIWQVWHHNITKLKWSLERVSIILPEPQSRKTKGLFFYKIVCLYTTAVTCSVPLVVCTCEDAGFWGGSVKICTYKENDTI